MHSTQGPSDQVYRHSGDFSGDVQWEVGAVEGMGTDTVYMPFEDMRHLVLAYLRFRAVVALELADDETLEKFFSGWSR